MWFCHCSGNNYIFSYKIIAEPEQKNPVDAKRNNAINVQSKTFKRVLHVTLRYSVLFANCCFKNAASRCVRLKEVLLFKTARLCAPISALMLGALGFPGVAVRAHGQQLMLNAPESSSSASSELPDALESKMQSGGAAQTSKTKKKNVSEFTVAVGVTAPLTTTRTVTQFPDFQHIVGTTPSAGFLATFQQQIRPLLGYDVNFGYTKLTENYQADTGVFAASPSVTSGVFTRGSVPANVFEISGAYTVKRPQYGSRFQPFAEAGGGVLIFAPTTAPFEGHTSYRAAFLFGGGVDYRLSANLGLRAEYRGLLYKNPDFGAVITPIPTTKYFTVTSEPTISLQYRFGHHGGMQ